MSDVLLDEDRVILEALDFDVSCKFCDANADWIAIMRCCKTEHNMCETCKKSELEAQMMSRERKCVACPFRWNASDSINIDWTKL